MEHNPADRPEGSGPAATAADDSVDNTTLQEENAKLRQRNAELEARAGRRHTVTGVLRSTAVVVLITLGALFLTVSVPAVWGRNLVLDTDRYVQTLTPLASDPGVQAAVVKAVDIQFQNHVDIRSTVQQVLPPAASVLAGPLQSAVNSLVNTVTTRFVQSQAFVTLWVELNRVAHTQVVAILTGKNSAQNVISIQNGTLILNLAPIVDQVKTRLVDAGLSIAKNVPSVGVTFEIAEVKGLTTARNYVKLLNTAADWLPVLGLLCLIGAVFTARRHRRTIIACGLSVAGGMLLIGLILDLARHIYIQDLPGVYLTSDTAGRMFDTLIRFLRLGLRVVLVVALIIAAIAWAFGPSRPARALRRGVMVAPRAIADRLPSSRFGAMVAANRGVALGVVGGLAALILVLWTNPPLWAVVLVLAIAALLMATLASLKRPPAADASATPPG